MQAREHTGLTLFYFPIAYVVGLAMLIWWITYTNNAAVMNTPNSGPLLILLGASIGAHLVLTSSLRDWKRNGYIGSALNYIAFVVLTLLHLNVLNNSSLTGTTVTDIHLFWILIPIAGLGALLVFFQPQWSAFEV
jgi:hypothetical protein